MQALPAGSMSDVFVTNHFSRLFTLVKGAFSPPPGQRRIMLALAAGILCHSIFAAAVLSMVVAMFFGLSLGLGRVPWPWGFIANAALIVQFPLGHSLLLTTRGRKWLARIIPGAYGATLSTTTYAIIASLQLLMLFVLWTPSGIIFWQAEGWAFWMLCSCYAAAWLVLGKASFDAGLEVQSGGLGWLSLLQNIKPVFPDMPQGGLFRFIRQPIYVAFALTLWTVPVWTPDQLVLAISYTAYCLLAPRLKERRFAAFYGDRFMAYQVRVPYACPHIPNIRHKSDDLTKLNKNSELL